jgi:hypothetical protein
MTANVEFYVNLLDKRVLLEFRQRHELLNGETP